MSTTFSAGTDNFFAILDRSGPAGKLAFPRNWDDRMARALPDETTPAWFKRCTEEQLEDDLGRCKVDSRLGLFLGAEWENDHELRYVNFQAIVVLDEELESLYFDPSVPHRYYRLDLDRSAPGSIFKEPFPHVHVALDGEPRFAVGAESDGNVLVDFVDFIYRNHFHEAWADWADRVCEKAFAEREQENAFTDLAKAFEDGRWEYLTQNEQNLAVVREALRAARGRMSRFRVPGSLRRALNL